MQLTSISVSSIWSILHFCMFYANLNWYLNDSRYNLLLYLLRSVSVADIVSKLIVQNISYLSALLFFVLIYFKNWSYGLRKWKYLFWHLRLLFSDHQSLFTAFFITFYYSLDLNRLKRMVWKTTGCFRVDFCFNFILFYKPILWLLNASPCTFIVGGLN